jgi:molybdate transport system substrate-binding protein
MRARTGFPLAILLVLGVLSCSGEPRSITVYAAASLTEAIEDAAKVYADSTGQKIDTRFGATGMLATLVKEGGPADVFLSADAEWMDDLAHRGLVDATTAQIVAWNQLVFVVPRSDSSQAPRGPEDLAGLSKIAMGDPETVPAGRYAKQALTTLGLWPQVEAKMVHAPDVRAVLALVERGEVDGGVVYGTDARMSQKARPAFVFPESSHDPVAYPGALVLSGRHPKAALEFLEFLSSPRGRAIFEAHGFQES